MCLKVAVIFTLRAEKSKRSKSVRSKSGKLCVKCFTELEILKLFLTQELYCPKCEKPQEGVKRVDPEGLWTQYGTVSDNVKEAGSK